MGLIFGILLRCFSPCNITIGVLNLFKEIGIEAEMHRRKSDKNPP